MALGNCESKGSSATGPAGSKDANAIRLGFRPASILTDRDGPAGLASDSVFIQSGRCRSLMALRIDLRGQLDHAC